MKLASGAVLVSLANSLRAVVNMELFGWNSPFYVNIYVEIEVYDL